MSSEEYFGICKQPVDTCPLINEAVSNLKEAIAYLKNPDTEEPEQMAKDMAESEWYVDFALGQLEEIREANSEIRTWGLQWKDLAKETKKELEDMAA